MASSHKDPGLAFGRVSKYRCHRNDDKAETRTVLVPPNRSAGKRVFQHHKPWSPTAPAYGRYWIDVPGADRKRRTVPLGALAARGALHKVSSASTSKREASIPKRTFTSTTAPATTFRVQAARWIQALSTRRRKPVKPATIAGWQHSLDKWVLPNLGDLLLSDVGNAALKEPDRKNVLCCWAFLSNHLGQSLPKVVTMVVASAVNSEGEQIYARKWNHDFVGLPRVEPTKQYRPTVTEPELREVLATARERYAVLFALLAGTGLRIGEALGLRATDFSPDCRVLHVRRSIWRGQEQEPKTPNAMREVDLAEPLSRLLSEYAREPSGYPVRHEKRATTSPRAPYFGVCTATGRKGGLRLPADSGPRILRRAGVPEDTSNPVVARPLEEDRD